MPNLLNVINEYSQNLRRYFLYDHKLLSDLSRCGWEALKAFNTAVTRDQQRSWLLRPKTFVIDPWGAVHTIRRRKASPQHICNDMK